MKVKEGDRIFTVEGSGIVQFIEEHFGKKRYCIELDNKNTKFGETTICFRENEIMNDIGYIDEPYEKSICCTSIEGTNDSDRLKNKLKAVEGAISFHKDEGNPKQVLFFESARDHISKKLKIKTKSEEDFKPGTQLSLI